MGQKLGKPTFLPGVEPFLNLPSSSVHEFWEAYTLLSDGWGLNEAALLSIIKRSGLVSVLGVDNSQVPEVAGQFFKVLDTDKNGMVDALELMGTLIVISGMDPSDKLRSAFKLYDFNESGSLTCDELALAMQSTATGLCKIAGLPTPAGNVFESLAALIVSKTDSSNSTASGSETRIDLQDILKFCETDPTAVSWIAYYDDLQDSQQATTKGIVDVDKDVQIEIDVAEKLKSIPSDDLPPPLAFPPQPPAAELTGWRRAAAQLKPSELPKEVLTAPASELNLEWIYGYSAQEARSNLRYTASGDIVYHASSASVVYRKPTEERLAPIQEYNLEHHSEIVSFAITADLTTVATGGVGKSPSIVVWDAATTKTLAILSGFHANAVTLLDFSADGKLLLSVGKDEDNSVAIYEWQTATKVFGACVSKDGVFDARFAGSGYLFATSNKAGITFWLPKGPGGGGEWVKQKGIFGKKAPVQPIVALSPFDKPNQLLAGTANGELLLWEGRSLIRSVKAHDLIITVITFHRGTSTVITSAKDKHIKRWSASLEPLSVIDMLLLSSVDPIVRSVTLSEDGRRLLVGTRGGDIFELAASNEPAPEGGDAEPIRVGTDLNGGPLVSGHKAGKVWGLAMSASGDFATVGEDKSLRTWDLAAHKQKKVMTFDSTGRAVAFSPIDPNTVAVGFGAGLEEKEVKEGALVVVNLETLTETATFRDSHQAILDVKFSPDGANLAAASSDSTIYLYRAEATGWAFRLKISKHNDAVTHVDFSADGQWIRSESQADLRVFNVETGEQLDALGTLKDTEWATEACLCTYALQGLSQGAFTAVHKGAAPLVAAVDGSGKVKLFNYPSISGNGRYKSFAGHASDITNVRFTPGDTHVVTTGGDDHAVFQWALEVDEAPDSGDEVEEEAAPEAEEEEEEEEGNPRLPPESDAEEDYVDGNVLERSGLVDAVLTGDVEAMFELQDAAGEEVFMAVKAFQSQLEPQQSKKQQGAAHQQAPEDNLTLDWVYGYSGQAARSNVFYNASEDIVYPAAGLGVVFNKVQWQQKHHTSHTDAITASAIHPDGVLVATGQRGLQPHVSIWSSETTDVVRIIQLRAGSRAVSALAFSADGKTLAIATQDDQHTVYLYDWKSGQLKSKGEGGEHKILALSFSPDGRKLLQAGIKHFKLWLVKGRSLTGKPGLFGRTGGRRQPILSVGWYQNEGLLGAANGTLYRLEGRKISATVEAHKKGLTSIFTYDTPEGTWVLTGGLDGMVKIFDQDLAPANEFRVPRYHDLMSGQAKAVRSVWRNRDGRKILVGTLGGNILELSSTDGSVMNGGPLVTGHWKHSLTGLAAHPVRNEFATVGGDRLLRLWDMSTKKQINSLPLGELARSVAFAPNGLFVAVGIGADPPRSTDGSVFIVSLMEDALRIVTKKQDTNRAITVVKFTPNGQVLAAASLDGTVYLYDVLNNFKLKAKTTEILGPITHFDVSADSKHLVVNTSRDEIRHFDVKSGEKSGAIDHGKLSTWTSSMGWPVQGIYRDLAKGDHVPAVALSPDANLLATGDAYGKVNLFKYPAPTVGASFKSYSGHSAPVSNVAFSVEGEYIISVGSEDRTAFQWRREVEEEDIHEDAHEGNVDAEVAGELGLQVAPAALPSPSPSAPGGPRVYLESVSGVRQSDVRRNLFYTPAGAIVHFVARLGVAYDKASGGQVIYQGHGNDISAADLSPDGQYVLTGEKGPHPRGRIWDPVTGKEVAVLPLAHRGDIKLVAFSRNVKQAATVGLKGGNKEDCSLAIYATASGTWEDASLVAQADLDRRRPLFLLFPGFADFQVVTGGAQHLVFWRLQGRSLSWKRGSWGKKGGGVKPAVLLTAAVVEGALVTGTQSGQLLVWYGRECIKSVASAHEGPILSLVATPKGGILTGDKHGVIKLWDNDLVLLKSYSLQETATPTPSSTIIRSLAIDRHQARIAVGLKTNQIYEVIVDTGAGVKLQEGLARILAAATHPTEADKYAVVTVGDVVSVVSSDKVALTTFVNSAGEAIAWSPDGAYLAVSVGTKATTKEGVAGSIAVLRSADLSEVATLQDVSHTYATDLRFSPDSVTLAAVYADGNLVIYDINIFKKRWKGGPHKADPTYRLSFANSGVILRAWPTSGAVAPFLVDPRAGEVIKQAIPEDTTWVGQDSPLVAATHPSGSVTLSYSSAATPDSFTTLIGLSSEPRATSLVADGSHVLTFGADGTVLSHKVVS